MLILFIQVIGMMLLIIVIFLIIFYNAINVHFLNRFETVEFIKNDPDKYISNFSKYDLMARHAKSKIEYLNDQLKHASNFTLGQKIKILYCAYHANAFIKNYDFNKINLKINNNEFANMPWKLALMGNTYEEGYPHTRNNIIFLSLRLVNTKNLTYLISILLHEKLHIYQKIYADNFKKNLVNNGFQIYSKNTRKLNRCNPDKDDIIYTKNSRLYYLDYSSEFPNSIIDVNGDSTFEHPNEYFAYLFAKQYIDFVNH